MPECASFRFQILVRNPGKQLTFGETEIRKLAQNFCLNERETIRGFCEYLQENEVPDKLLTLKHTLSTSAISSSECERGFSQSNRIVTSSRSCLLYRKLLH